MNEVQGGVGGGESGANRSGNIDCFLLNLAGFFKVFFGLKIAKVALDGLNRKIWIWANKEGWLG